MAPKMAAPFVSDGFRRQLEMETEPVVARSCLDLSFDIPDKRDSLRREFGVDQSYPNNIFKYFTALQIRLQLLLTIQKIKSSRFDTNNLVFLLLFYHFFR